MTTDTIEMSVDFSAGLEIDIFMPSPDLDYQLSPCPKCGAEHLIIGGRVGPTIIMFTRVCYRVICQKCYYKSKIGKTAEIAITKWNEQKKPSKVKEIRLAQGISQLKLAEMAELSSHTVSRIENNESVPTQVVREKIAKALNINPNVI